MKPIPLIDDETFVYVNEKSLILQEYQELDLGEDFLEVDVADESEVKPYDEI